MPDTSIQRTTEMGTSLIPQRRMCSITLETAGTGVEELIWITTWLFDFTPENFASDEYIAESICLPLKNETPDEFILRRMQSVEGRLENLHESTDEPSNKNLATNAGLATTMATSAICTAWKKIHPDSRSAFFPLPDFAAIDDFRYEVRIR